MLMKSHKNIITMYMFLTGLFILFLLSSYFDQIHQSSILTNPRNFTMKVVTPMKSKEKDLINNLEKLRFSKLTISNMSDDDIQYYGKLKGKVVDNITIYKKITKQTEKNLSKKEYQDYLQKYSSFHLSTLKLERIQLKLIYEGKGKFIFLTEHHFDFSPSDLNPMHIELQYRDQYIVLNKSAKQVYWTASSFHSSSVKQGKIVYRSDHSFPPTNNEEPFGYFQSNINSSFYYVDWHKPNLFQDIVGAYFYTISEFEVQGNPNRTDVFIQGGNPTLSEQVTYDVEEKQKINSDGTPDVVR